MIRRQSERQSLGQCNRSAAALWWFRRGLMMTPPRSYDDSAAVLWWLERDLMIIPPWSNDHSTVAEWWFHHGRMMIPPWPNDYSIVVLWSFDGDGTMVPSPLNNGSIAMVQRKRKPLISNRPWEFVGFALSGSLFRLGRQSLSSCQAVSSVLAGSRFRLGRPSLRAWREVIRICPKFLLYYKIVVKSQHFSTFVA